jgi:PAS domain S-box-containing protein
MRIARPARRDPGLLIASGFALYAIAFTVWAALGVGSLRQRTAISDLAFLPITPVGAFLAWRTARHPSLGDRVRRAWQLIALANLSWWTGDLLWSVFEVIRREEPFPSAADAFYLMFYPLVLSGILLAVSGPRRRVAQLRVVLDVLTITAVGGMLTWYFVIRAVAAQAEPSTLAQVLNIAYPTGDILLVLSCSLALVRRWHTSVDSALRVLALGAAMFVAADIAFARLSLSERYGPGTGPDILWMWALWLLLLAPVLHWRVATQPAAPEDVWTRPAISPLPFIALLAEFVLLLQVVARGGLVSVTVLVAGSMAVTVFVAAGQLLALIQNAALIDERERFERIVASSNDAIVACNLDGAIMSWNPAAERMYGYSAADAIGRKVVEIVPPERRLEMEEQLARVARGEQIELDETVRLTRDGQLVPVAVSISPVRAATGEVTGVSTMARDLTEVRRMAAALTAALAQAEAALAGARDAEESTRRFLDNAAHQLRTPIAGIQACAEMLLRSLPGEQAPRLLAAIRQETDRAGRLIRELLELARLDRAPDLHRVPIDVRRVVDAEAGRARRADHIAVEVVADEPLATVEVDQHALHEALSNLLDNAVRHARSSVTVHVTTRESLEIRVRDDGPGLGDEQARDAFDRFVSFDGGSGLGLPIARSLARAHGGDVTYEDRAFVIRMPRV